MSLIGSQTDKLLMGKFLFINSKQSGPQKISYPKNALFFGKFCITKSSIISNKTHSKSVGCGLAK